MSLKLRASLSLVAVLFFLIVMAGCGSGNQITPPAPEGFTNANLNGTFSFSVTGTDAATNSFFSIAGSLQANGSGQITGGTVDINSPGTLATPINTTVSGTYSVLSDGRTVANLTTPAGNFTIDFVLLSNTQGLVVRFDNNASASGSLDLQNSSAFSNTALAGSFAFNLSGVDSGGNSDSTAGAFTFNSSGGVTTGVQDLNDNGAVFANTTITGGTVASPTTGRGTVTLDTSNGALDFAFYVIDANHIRLISTDTFPIFSGDAFRQPASFTTSSAFAAGSSAFTLAGASGGSPLVTGGILTADGNGNITSGTEDVNQNGNLSQNISVNGTYTVANTGRGTLNLGGTAFAIYPTTTGGLLMLDLNTAIASGTALQQGSASFSNSSINGTYGLNFTGVNLNLQTEVDAIAQFTADGNGNMKGAFDFNNEGALNPNLSLAGTYSISANGRGTGTLTSSAGSFSVIYYVVSSSRVLFIEADGLQPSVGLFAQQTM
jgi:hypothetical protein